MKAALFFLLLPTVILFPYKVEGGSVRKAQARVPLKPIISLQLIATHVLPHKPVMNLTFNTVNTVNLQTLGFSTAKFNIKAVANSTVKSVKFSNGVLENSLPFAYCGNNGEIYSTCTDLILGAQKNITAIGYPQPGQQGTAYPVQWASINIIRGTVSLPSASAPVPAPVPVPVRPVPVPVAMVSAPVPAPNRAAPVPVAVTVPPLLRTCTLPKMDTEWWSTPAKPYPISVAESQGSMIGNDFVIFSGFKNGYSNATTETYALDMSVSDASWRRMDDMPFPQGLTHIGIAVAEMKAYICGGYVGGSLGTHAANCFIYNHSKLPGAGQQWSSFVSLPKGGRAGGGMIFDSTLNALIYAGGSQRPIQGQRSAIDFFDTWMYSINNPSAGWVSKTNIPFHGNHMNFVTAYDSIGLERHYFFGGQEADNEPTGNTATMYEYMVSTDTWIQRTSMPFPRGHSAASSRAVGCGFIVAGGRTNTGLTSDITYFDIANNTWTLIGNLPVEIHTNVCVVVQGMLRCETGWADGTFSAQRPIIV
jgi:N-acetylneuraminic acid mutarotase